MVRSRGFTLIELMIVVAIIAIIAAVAIPSLLNARKSGNETSAIGFLKTAVTAAEQYRVRFGTYPSSEDNLFSAGLIPQSQGPSGYILNLETTPISWRLRAAPETPGVTGDRYFIVDHTGVIRFSSTGGATTTDPPIGS